jgi:alginate O-acetyltransferase complex protein AlgI
VQLNKSHHLNHLQIVNAFKTILWGFFLKMVLADNIAIMVNAQFEDIHTTTDSLSWWYCMLGFAFQIYFDFNGYSSIARGLAKLCGIHFRLNFNHPYLSGSFSEFWRRWHISLSSFFKDYVYISLGGNRKGKWRSEWNRWITMLLSGLWHGANFTFIIWGGLHAFYLSIENLYRRFFASRIPALTFKKYPLIVFIGVLIAWVFFRASNVDDALFVVRNMFAFNHNVKWMELISNSATIWILIGVFVELYPLYKRFINPFKHWIIQGFFWALIVCMLVFFRGEEQGFIYFQF